MADDTVQFPSKLTESERFFIQFDIFKMHAPLDNVKEDVIAAAGGAKTADQKQVLTALSNQFDNLNTVFDYSKKADTLLYSIQLPLQDIPTEGSSLNYGDQGTQALQNIGTLLSSARAAGTDAAAGGGFNLDTIKNFFSSGAGAVQSEIQKALPEVVGLTANRLQGKAKNTMQQTFFEGPNKKGYSFNFELVARNSKDSDDMALIANRFQYYANPGLTGEGNYWTYPEVVRFFYMERDGDVFRKIKVLSSSSTNIKDGAYESKACFIESVGIEYGDDEYLLFSSPSGKRGIGKMKLALTLKEAEYFTKEDYRRGGDPEIPNQYGPNPSDSPDK